MANLIEIADPADSRLADYRDLRDVELRKSLESSEGLFLAEGEKVVRRAVTGGFEPRSFLMAPKWLDGLADVLATTDAPCYVMSEKMAEAVTGFHVHRGALASMRRRALPSVEDVLAEARSARSKFRGNADLSIPEAGGESSTGGSPRRARIAVLENLVDHANVGSAFRNAAALGVDAVLVTPACADPLYRRAIKTSMGNVFNVSWTRTSKMPDTLATLRAHGYTTVALTLSADALTLDELVARDVPALALIFGTEGAGVDPRTARQADLRVTIPMEADVDSLNVAAATAVTFYATR